MQVGLKVYKSLFLGCMIFDELGIIIELMILFYTC